MAILFAFALVLVQALAAGALNPCTVGKENFSTITEIKELAQKMSRQDCPNYLRAAVVELARIISVDREDLCSVDAIDTLRGYYTQYLDNQSLKEDRKAQLPRTLRDYVIGYGLQMSNLCKKQMVKVLTQEARLLLDVRDFEQIDRLTNDQSPLAEVLKSMGGGIDAVFLPGDLANVMNKNGGRTQDKLFMQTATAPWVRKLQGVCQHRFKPVYEPLIIPLTRLSNMGFDYKDETLKNSLEDPVAAKEVGQWARIVFLCESLDTIHVVEDPDNKDLTEGTAEQAVRVISKEEAVAIEGAAAVEADSAVSHLDYRPKEKVRLDDVVLHLGDRDFVKTVRSFKVGESEAAMTKKAMITRGVAMLKSHIKKGKVGMVVSSAFRAVASKEVNSPGAAMVKTLDEIVASKNNQGADGNVSGLYYGEGDWFDIVMHLVMAVVCLGLAVLLSLAVFGLISLLG